MKKTISILLFILIVFKIYGQPSFPNDTTYSPFFEGTINDLDSLYKIKGDKNFEFRLWIITHKPFYRIQLFSLYQNNNILSARCFEQGWVQLDSLQVIKKYIEEKAIPDTSQQNIQKLLKLLNKNNYLTNQRSEDVTGRNGKRARLYGCHCYDYVFVLLSNKNKRIYNYDCPVIHAKKYKNIKVFKNIVNITKAIFEFCGLKDYRPC